MAEPKSEWPLGRAATALPATLIAVVAWSGLVLNFVDVSARGGSTLETLWVLADYFTILTNLLIALVFTALALTWRRPAPTKIIAGLTLSILLVGIVYQLLLRGLYVMTPTGYIADVLLHRVTPVAVPLFWLLMVPKGRLTLRDPFVWSLYPLAYFAYATVRGTVTGHYPYPFMDVAKIGWSQVIGTSAVIAFGFIASGLAMVWLDGILAGRAQPRAE